MEGGREGGRERGREGGREYMWVIVHSFSLSPQKQCKAIPSFCILPRTASLYCHLYRLALRLRTAMRRRRRAAARRRKQPQPATVAAATGPVRLSAAIAAHCGCVAAYCGDCSLLRPATATAAAAYCGDCNLCCGLLRRLQLVLRLIAATAASVAAHCGDHGPLRPTAARTRAPPTTAGRLHSVAAGRGAHPGAAGSTSWVTCTRPPF